MTSSAMNFIGPITFSTLTANPVRTELFPETAPSEIPHTDLGRTSDIVLIAPATAKIIAKFAQGISDDLMSALLLSSACPIVMAPAMHTEMWENDATAQNVRTLAARGVRFVGPESGPLAGPDVGVGRLAEPARIIEVVEETLRERASMSGVEVLVTAGGTREPIDAVRYIANDSSGRMGFAIAHEALRRGAKVTLIAAPSPLPTPHAAEVTLVRTASEMHDAVMSRADRFKVIIMAAAVADWTPSAPSKTKLKKSDGPPPVRLEPTRDILAELGQGRSKFADLRALVGFCAESEDVSVHAIRKLQEKGADMIVGNLVGTPDSGFETETNRATLAFSPDDIEELPLMSKIELARHILDAIASRFL